jgi:hypothetical protein
LTRLSAQYHRRCTVNVDRHGIKVCELHGLMISSDNGQLASEAVERSLRARCGARSNNLFFFLGFADRRALVVDAPPLRQTRGSRAEGPRARCGAHFVSVVAAGRQYRRRSGCLRASATAACGSGRNATSIGQVVQRFKCVGKSACHFIDVVEKICGDVSI